MTVVARTIKSELGAILQMTLNDLFQASVNGSDFTEFRFVDRNGGATPWQLIPPGRNILPALRKASQLLAEPIDLEMRKSTAMATHS
jgi:hypothetical protein